MYTCEATGTFLTWIVNPFANDTDPGISVYPAQPIGFTIRPNVWVYLVNPNATSTGLTSILIIQSSGSTHPDQTIHHVECLVNGLNNVSTSLPYRVSSNYYNYANLVCSPTPPPPPPPQPPILPTVIFYPLIIEKQSSRHKLLFTDCINMLIMYINAYRATSAASDV